MSPARAESTLGATRRAQTRSLRMVLTSSILSHNCLDFADGHVCTHTVEGVLADAVTPTDPSDTPPRLTGPVIHKGRGRCALCVLAAVVMPSFRHLWRAPVAAQWVHNASTTRRTAFRITCKVGSTSPVDVTAAGAEVHTGHGRVPEC